MEGDPNTKPVMFGAKRYCKIYTTVSLLVGLGSYWQASSTFDASGTYHVESATMERFEASCRDAIRLALSLYYRTPLTLEPASKPIQLPQSLTC
jgi:hypothetical protein